MQYEHKLKSILSKRSLLIHLRCLRCYGHCQLPNESSCGVFGLAWQHTGYVCGCLRWCSHISRLIIGWYTFQQWYLIPTEATQSRNKYRIDHWKNLRKIMENQKGKWFPWSSDPQTSSEKSQKSEPSPRSSLPALGTVLVELPAGQLLTNLSVCEPECRKLNLGRSWKYKQFNPLRPERNVSLAKAFLTHQISKTNVQCNQQPKDKDNYIHLLTTRFYLHLHINPSAFY